MLTIRLTRKGKKNQPFFKLVVIDKRKSSKGGRAVEELGYVNPLTKKKNFKAERIKYWLKTGAQPSATVHNLLVTEKIIDAKKITKKSRKPKETPVVATPATPAPAAEKQAEQPKPEVKEEPKPEEKPAA